MLDVLDSAYLFYILALINEDFAGCRATMQPICSCSNSSAWEEYTGMRVFCIVSLIPISFKLPFLLQTSQFELEVLPDTGHTRVRISKS